MSEDWQVDSHDKEIKELRDKLREAKTEVWNNLREAQEKFWNDIRETKKELRKELQESEEERGKELQKANDKILALENRPHEWFVKVMPVTIGIMVGAYVALLIAGIIHKH